MPDFIQIQPKEELNDPVGKMRVSTPRALTDTDFEYGLQPTKWEFVNLINNRPTAFYNPTSPLTITDVTGTGTTRVVTVLTASPPAVGTPVYIQETTDNNANGWYLVDTVSAGVNFTYVAKGNVANGSVYNSSKTYVFSASFYTGSFITVSASAGAAFTNTGTTVTGTTTYAHGLSVGNPIYVVGTTATTNPPNGSWVVATVPTANTFTFTVVNAPTGTITAAGGATASLYARPNGASIHRAFDGGVQFTAGAAAPGSQMIRQTRRYFRYQSGKGVQFSTGTSVKPNVNVDSLTASGTTVTATTKYPHNLVAGVGILVSGATQSQYNGTWTVATTPTDTTFTFVVNNAPTVSPATGFPIFCNPTSWSGGTVRIGMFDQQNGAFFEYDGQTLYAVRRFSTYQLSGTISATNGSNAITGTNTFFANQLVPGDFIVIRGGSYRVQSITSQTAMLIVPEYKGATASNIVPSKTTDLRVPQSSWNIDKCDGSGPSGYNVDLTKMQMFYIDYSWYGAGAIRWGFRTNLGDIKYCHKLQNNNTNYEAWMRSGNLPAHYESNTIHPYTTLSATLNSGDTTISVIDTSNFPSSGTIRVVGSGNTGTIEYITYTGKTATTFTGLTRGATGGSAATTFTYSATAPQAVELALPAPSAPVSHWGCSVIMDGGFDNDASLQFNAGMTSTTSISSGTTNALLSIRLSPSVDSGITGTLGVREILNRMQLKLTTIDALSTGQFRINLLLNPTVSSGSFTAAGGSSLSQICLHSAGVTTTGGEVMLGFFTNNAGGSTNPTLTTYDLTAIRDIGNSILGGGTNNNVPTTQSNLYPDGPDVVVITATNIGSGSANVQVRISWTEAQA